MRDTVYVLVFDGCADWPAARALCEVRRPGDWPVRTLGFSRAPVVSMGGLTLQPDAALAELAPDRAVLLIVPGSTRRLPGEGAVAVERLREAHAAGATVANVPWGTALDWTTTFQPVPELPVIRGYIDRVLAHPAMRRAQSKDVAFVAQPSA